MHNTNPIKNLSVLLFVFALSFTIGCKKESDSESETKATPTSYMTFNQKSYKLNNYQIDTTDGKYSIKMDYFYISDGTTYSGGTTISFKYRNTEPDLGEYFKLNNFFNDTLNIRMKVKEESSSHLYDHDINCVTGKLSVSMENGKKVFNGIDIKFMFGDSGSFHIIKP